MCAVYMDRKAPPNIAVLLVNVTLEFSKKLISDNSFVYTAPPKPFSAVQIKVCCRLSFKANVTVIV